MFNLRQYNFKKLNFLLLAAVILISILGVFFISKVDDSNLALKQILGIFIGLIAIAVVSLLDYHFICQCAIPLYLLNMLLLCLVKFTPLGVTHYSATRWLNFPFFDLQPDELTKVIMIISFAAFFSLMRERMDKWLTVLLSVLILVAPLIIVFLQPHLSTCLLIGFVFVVMIYVAGLSYKLILTIFAVGIPTGLGTLFYIMQPDQKLITYYQRGRIMAALFPDSEASADTLYQQLNAVNAIGSGRLSGKMFGDAADASRSYNAVPVRESDFIFTVIGEELGFIGGCVIIGLLAFIIFQCLLTAIRAKDRLGMLLATGITAWLAFQVFINIGVTTKMLPNTGQPLPFVSYGLTNLVSCMIGIGIIINIGLQNKNIRG